MVLVACVFFFFQAEDGIRDRSPSRGLGDVYKRQHKEIAAYYQIQSVPTLMIFKDGKQLWRQSGVMRANDLSTILAQYE